MIKVFNINNLYELIISNLNYRLGLFEYTNINYS